VYSFELEFYKEVVPEDSKRAVSSRHAYFVIKKKQIEGYWPRLTKDSKKLTFLKTDFNKWKEEDESDDDKDVGGDFDMSNFGGMPGMGGMGGMGGMPGMGGMGGMAGLENMMKGGMGGMGGMPGMPGGMGGFDGMDDEDEGEEKGKDGDETEDKPDKD